MLCVVMVRELTGRQILLENQSCCIVKVKVNVM